MSQDLKEKKRVASQLAFIHQSLTQKQQFFMDEFDIAKDAARTITAMFNQINDEIKSQEEPIEAKTTESEASEPEAAVQPSKD
jgi:predicted Zn-dependent peptidase